MKKQINPTIKAHLIRGAFYLLLLIAVCAIPFALAQRNAPKRSGATISKFAGSQAIARGIQGVPRFLSAAQVRRPATRVNRLLRSLLPNSVYMIDDGTAENGVGFGNGSQNFEALWFNQFEVIAGQTSISTVSVAWGTPLFPDPSNNGTAVTIAIWSDPNGDGDPHDAVLLGSVAGTIQNEGTDTFIDYTFNPPIDISGLTSFFVGDMTPMNNGPEHFYQGIDQDSTLHRQSWVAANADGSPVDINRIGNNDTIGIVDDFGIPGNWLVRADTGAPVSPTPTATGTPACTPIVINGSIDLSDPTQTDRLFRSGIPQTCPATTTCSIFGDPTPHHYDSYTFTNTTGSTQCVHIDTNTACTGTNFIFTAAYMGSFDPNNICTNWIGDSGSSPNPDQAFDVDVDNGQTLIVVVSEVTPDAGCPSYTLTVTGLCGGGTPTPTPTPPPEITLRAEGRKVNGVDTVRLSWSRATSNQVDIYRCIQQLNGCSPAVIATTRNDGRYIDSTGHTGQAGFRYKVCEAGTQTCSNPVGVTFER